MYETFLKQHKDDLDIQNCKLTFARYVEGVKVIQDSKVKKDADGQNDGENA